MVEIGNTNGPALLPESTVVRLLAEALDDRRKRRLGQECS
jgi:hypothetical protein